MRIRYGNQASLAIEKRYEIVWEVADLWFHSLILLEATGVPAQDVFRELARRRQ